MSSQPYGPNSREEENSYEETMQLIRYTFSCIAYIREFFPDDNFEDSHCLGMALKRLRKHVNVNTDRLIDWIELGCGDALQKKYLETITLGIHSDEHDNAQVIESYTLTIGYPASELHNIIKEVREDAKPTETHITVTSNEGGKKIIKAETREPFGKQIVKMLRTLCIMMQTLKSLPSQKYVGMQLTYYDEVTPPDYVPPGFMQSVFDINYIFNGPTFKHGFGQVQSSHHNINLDLETLKFYADREDEEPAPVAVPKIQPAKGGDVSFSLTLSQPPPAAVISPSQDTIGIDDICCYANDLVPELRPRVSTVDLIKGKNVAILEAKDVRCLCGDNENDLDMILCDDCSKWQHTPCAGFYTNRDKRIPEKYICYSCQYRGHGKLLKSLQDLSSIRRAISVVYSEGLQSIKWLSKRLECGVAKAARLIRKMEGEGLISRPETQARSYAFTVHKTSEAKEKIKFFFSHDLSVFPGLACFLVSKDHGKAPKISPKRSVGAKKPFAEEDKATKRLKSVNAEKITCM